MTEKRKKISIPSSDYKLVYGLSYGKIDAPFYETEENIKLLLLDGVKVNEHIKEKVVALTLENYNKDNSLVTVVPQDPPPVPEVTVQSVTLSLDAPSIKQGETTQVTADIQPVEAKDKTVTYSSENDLVARVEQNGTVTAVGEGSTNIVGTTSNGKEGKVEITVTVE